MISLRLTILFHNSHFYKPLDTDLSFTHYHSIMIFYNYQLSYDNFIIPQLYSGYFDIAEFNW